MKKCHRILCIVLALVLVAGLLPATAMAADTVSGHLIINRLSNITTSSDVTSVEDNAKTGSVTVRFITAEAVETGPQFLTEEILRH